MSKKKAPAKGGAPGAPPQQGTVGMLPQLGSHLKSQRGNRGLREIAAEIGISAATLSRVEAGKQPDLDSFRKICEWLGEDPGKFLGYKGKSDSASSLMPPGMSPR